MKTYREKRIAVYLAEIERRGGETEIVGRYGTANVCCTGWRRGLALFTAHGWRQYSKRFGARKASLAYLCGTDDNGPWAVRVPGTVRTVAEAIEKIEPPQVRAARAAGRRVLRQGDLYAVERRRDMQGQPSLPASHRWDADTRTVAHVGSGRPHKPLHVPFPCVFVVQRVLQMGRLRNRRTGYGD